MKPVVTQLEEYLRSIAPGWVSSGELQRMPWKNKNGTLATPRSIVRRLEELAESGEIQVGYREKNHAWYSHSKPRPKPVIVHDLVFRDGRPVRVPRIINA